MGHLHTTTADPSQSNSHSPSSLLSHDSCCWALRLPYICRGPSPPPAATVPQLLSRRLPPPLPPLPRRRSSFAAPPSPAASLRLPRSRRSSPAALRLPSPAPHCRRCSPAGSFCRLPPVASLQPTPSRRLSPATASRPAHRSTLATVTTHLRSPPHPCMQLSAASSPPQLVTVTLPRQHALSTLASVSTLGIHPCTRMPAAARLSAALPPLRSTFAIASTHPQAYSRPIAAACLSRSTPHLQ